MAVHRMNLPNDRNRHTGLAQMLWRYPEGISIKRDIPVLFATLFIYNVAGAQTAQKMEEKKEKKEMKDTVIVDGKLVEVGYKIIADGVTDGFAKIENGVVKGYKSIENGVVTGFNSVNDWFVSKLFQRKGETLEECKARLKANAENAGK